MEATRREFIVAGLGLAVAGCASQTRSGMARPGPLWPQLPPRPQARGGSVTVGPTPNVTTPYIPSPISAIPRSQWTQRGPIKSRINTMGKISQITVHHEGWTAVWFSDYRSTVARLQLIQRTHFDRRWADIGYHYIVDRGGRLWEGRSVQYQGAHVPGHNEHNVGVMVLGNFELQRPTDAQMATLQDTLVQLRRRYNVPISHVHTHQELTPTKCPGKALQPQMVAMRHNGMLSLAMAH